MAGSYSINMTKKLLFAFVVVAFVACSENRSHAGVENLDRIMTERSDSLTIVQSENGRRQHNFTAPLYEHYGLAREPYMEFRQGVTVHSFDDSTLVATSTLVADYAIFFEKQQLWETKGNVVATNKEGQKLETQQLFWNQKIIFNFK